MLSLLVIISLVEEGLVMFLKSASNEKLSSTDKPEEHQILKIHHGRRPKGIVCEKGWERRNDALSISYLERGNKKQYFSVYVFSVYFSERSKQKEVPSQCPDVSLRMSLMFQALFC